MNDKKRIIILLGIWLLLLVTAFLASRFHRTERLEVCSDFQTIQKRGYIRAGILQNTTDYYVENGTIKGFHYELVELFAKRFDLHTQYIVFDSYWDSFYALMTGKVDLLAMDLNDNLRLETFFLLTQPHSYSSHVLVQHKNRMLVDKDFNILPGNDEEPDKPFLLAVDALSGFYQDALYLSRRLNTSHMQLSFMEMPDMDDMLYLVNTKEIDMTIASHKVARSSTVFYRHLDYSVTLTDKQPLHWAVNKANVSLQLPLNEWLDSLSKTRYYAILFEKYYSPTSKNKQYQAMLANNAISLYDDLIKKYAKIHHIDWRLVAAVIYQESRFNSRATGKGGSYGLMQIMPGTAVRLGMKNPHAVESQIYYGCKYLGNLKKIYSTEGVHSIDLYKFVLAAYNAGSCHIDDARLLAKKKRYNPNKWQDVEQMLLKLSDKKYTRNVKLNCGNYNG
ncbi:MAG: transglycosylase SLT domain-containing protein, partial [Bacteroidales bacterium]|nr:transglycosylase SLT domain-containing protein [Bacteroidales bacterium]